MFRPKFQVQEKTMDFASKISYVAQETTCDKHRADKGEPCWTMPGNDDRLLRAICAKRVKKLYIGSASSTTRYARSQQGAHK